MADAARLLPLPGAALICLPLLWGNADGSDTKTTYVFLFLFLMWICLAVLAGLISAFLGPVEDEEPEAGSE